MREPVVSPAERARTIREHLEAIRHRADKGSYNGRPLDALESIGADAVAALAQMDDPDECHRPSLQDIGCFGLTGRCECDAPDGRSDCCACDQDWLLVPDPGVDAEHAEEDATSRHIWTSPDGLRAEKNCRHGCKAAGGAPCLTCMESHA